MKVYVVSAEIEGNTVSLYMSINKKRALSYAENYKKKMGYETSVYSYDFSLSEGFELETQIRLRGANK